MTRKLLAIQRVALGRRRLVALAVILAAVATAALKNPGFEEWCFDQAMRRDR